MSRQYIQMQPIGQLLRKHRRKRGMYLRHVAAELDIDPAILSKIERGIKTVSKDQIKKLEALFGLKKNILLVSYLSDKIADDLKEEETADKVIKAAKIKLKKLKTDNEK